MKILGAILETFKNFFLSLTDVTLLLHVCKLFLVFALVHSQQEEPSDAVFKVPVLPPPKTPEVILLEEFPSHVTRKKSCNTLLSNSGDITELNNGTMYQSADLFGNIDDCHSPGKETIVRHWFLSTQVNTLEIYAPPSIPCPVYCVLLPDSENSPLDLLLQRKKINS